MLRVDDVSVAKHSYPCCVRTDYGRFVPSMTTKQNRPGSSWAEDAGSLLEDSDLANWKCQVSHRLTNRHPEKTLRNRIKTSQQ